VCSQQPQIGCAAGSSNVIAKRDLQQLLDQPGAGSARGAGLGLCPHRPEVVRAGFDGVDDGAFANAVAAADFRLTRQCCNG
jgi:hypothetical protein